MVARNSRLELIKELYSFQAVHAPVIWRGVPLYAHRLLIGAGQRNGVGKDAAVITSEGVVGRVYAATPFSSEVELLTEINAAAGVVLSSSRLQGIVQGTGDEWLILNFIASTEFVPPGELVTTSGTDRIYPRGLPVGKVVSSSPEGVYQRIVVKPHVDYSRLEEVAVVLGH
jgi:rod shape-determining protein MreC